MKHTLLTICLIIFALPSWGGITFSGGNISGGNVSSSKSMETEYKIFDGLPCKFLWSFWNFGLNSFGDDCFISNTSD